MWIREFRVKNFKCLRDVTVTLEPLTVLIGKNDTGKTSFLEALALAGGAHRDERGDATARAKQFLSHGASPNDARVWTTLADGTPGDSNWFKGIGNLHIPSPIQEPYRLRQEQLRDSNETGVLKTDPLRFDGFGLVDALDRMHPRVQIAIEDEFVMRLPAFSRVLWTAVPTRRGAKELWFDLKNGGRIHCNQASDGAMFLLAYLTICHDEEPPPVILIEEPENGIHPGQLRYVVNTLKSLTEREPSVQVVLTTHSPFLLDFVPKEAVRVFARDADSGEVTVHPMIDLPGVKKMLDIGNTLGEIWLNVDEDELVQKTAVL